MLELHFVACLSDSVKQADLYCVLVHVCVQVCLWVKAMTTYFNSLVGLSVSFRD